MMDGMSKSSGGFHCSTSLFICFLFFVLIPNREGERDAEVWKDVCLLPSS